MLGQKHLIECHCSLSIYKDRKDIVYHKFVVYSKVNEDGSIIPKYSKCNNCGANHYVYDFCKSEVKAGKEDSDIALTIEDIKICLPEKIIKVLEQYNCTVETYEQIDDVFDQELFPIDIIINREIIEDEHRVKILKLNNKDRYKIQTETINLVIKE